MVYLLYLQILLVCMTLLALTTFAVTLPATSDIEQYQTFDSDVSNRHLNERIQREANADPKKKKHKHYNHGR